LVSTIRTKVEQAKGEMNVLQRQLSDFESKYEQENKTLEHIQEAQQILQQTAKQTQNKLSFHISEFITSALQSIWGEQAYAFELRFVEKRNKTEVEMLLKTDDGEISLDNLNNIRSGGGVLDVVALALRIALWSLRPNKQSILILDQPLSNLDQNHLPKAGELITELSRKLDMQFLMINHNPALADIADKTFFVEKTDGVSKVRS
jgi:DNA repair exonuclease SbcCD ATPase subunit